MLSMTVGWSVLLSALRYTSGFMDDVIFHIMALWRAICIPKAALKCEKPNKRDSNQILLNDRDQQVLILTFAPGAKSVMKGCFAYSKY